MLFRKRCIFCENRISGAASVWNDRLLCICADCMRGADDMRAHDIIDALPPLARVVPCVYYTGRIREAIRKYKFEGHRAYAGAFSYIAAEKINSLWDAYLFDAVVTLPLSKERMNERGFNQSRFLSELVSGALGIPVRDEYLTKPVNTRRQSGLKYMERVKNIAGAYSASDEVRGKNIIITDDIYTTGSTCAEAARTLKAKGAETVMAVVFAARREKTRLPL